MSGLPVIKASKLVSILVRFGFRIIRQRGSHLHLVHILDKTGKTTIPMHNHDLPRKTLKSVLKQTKISNKEFFKLLGK